MNGLGLVLGLVVAAAGEPTEVSTTFTAGAGVLLRSQPGSGTSSGWAHVGLRVRRDFERAFVDVSGSLFLAGNLLGMTLRDYGSRVTLGTRFDGFVREVRLELQPFNPVARLPMFDWANALGRPAPDAIFTPTLAAELRTTAGSAWLAGRFRQVLNNLLSVHEVRPDLLAGLDVPLPAGLEVGLRGAWLQYGLIPSLAQQGIVKDSRALVGSARLAWTWNEPVGAPVDLLTYANDPFRFERFFTLEPRRTSHAATLALEGGLATQLLMSPNQFAARREQPASWADLQARVRLRELRLFAIARYQSASLLVFDTPGIPPFFAFNPRTTGLPHLAGFLGADWHWASARLTPGLLVGLRRSAALIAERFDFGGTNPPPGFDAPRTVLLEGDGLYGILPLDVAVRPRLNVKASLCWSPVPALSVLAFLDVENDWSHYDYVSATELAFVERVTVRSSLQLQARF